MTSINSLVKAIRIMELFSPDEPRLTLTEISGRLSMPKSTAHHILATLLNEGFVEKVDGDSYALGTAVIALTQNVRVNVELRDRAAPILRGLADQTRETVYLTVPDGGYVLYIYAVESPQRLLARTAIGDRVSMHCTSVGKAVLAYYTAEEQARVVANTGLPAFTPATITEFDALRHELELTKYRGYAIDREEHETHTFCIGAPIFGIGQRVVGSCSISGADPEILGSRMPSLVENVVSAAEDVSRRMGYVPSTATQSASAARRNGSQSR